MQPPRNPNPLSSSSSSSSSSNQPEKERGSSSSNNGIEGGGASASAQRKNHNQNQLLPTPQELIAHYESQGMEMQDASFKVIDDLQKMLVRVLTSERGKKDKLISDVSRKLDIANSRLAILETKLDSKPGFLQALGIGVVSSAAWPHLAAGAAQIWSAVRGATKSPPPG